MRVQAKIGGGLVTCKFLITVSLHVGTGVIHTPSCILICFTHTHTHTHTHTRTHTHTHAHTHTHTHTHTLQHSKPEQFNNFLRELKADLVGTRYSVFWSGQLEPAGLTLVDSSECAASTVSPEEARDVRLNQLASLCIVVMC